VLSQITDSYGIMALSMVLGSYTWHERDRGHGSWLCHGSLVLQCYRPSVRQV